MKIKNIFACENVIVSVDGKLSVINIFEEIRASGFPAVHPKFNLLISLMADVGSYEEKVEIVSLGDDKIIASTSAKAEVNGPGGNNLIVTFVNTAFPGAGEYWIRVTVDGNVLTDKDRNKISVIKK